MIRTVILRGTRSIAGADPRLVECRAGRRLVTVLEAGEVSVAPSLAERVALLALNGAAGVVRSTRILAACECGAAGRLTGSQLRRTCCAQVSEGLANARQRGVQSVASADARGRVAQTL